MNTKHIAMADGSRQKREGAFPLDSVRILREGLGCRTPHPQSPSICLQSGKALEWLFQSLASGGLTGGPRLRMCSFPSWLFGSVQGRAAFRADCVLRAPSECVSGGPALQCQAVFLSQHVQQHLFPDPRGQC